MVQRTLLCLFSACCLSLGSQLRKGAGVVYVRRLADGQEERLPARLAHDVLGRLVGLELRLGLLLATRLGVALTLLLRTAG